jgi:hypothetical protein
MGGFSPNTFRRIVNYDTNGWLGAVTGPLEYLEQSIMTIRDNASKANKDPNSFKIILLTYPNVIDSKNQQMKAKDLH